MPRTLYISLTNKLKKRTLQEQTNQQKHLREEVTTLSSLNACIHRLSHISQYFHSLMPEALLLSSLLLLLLLLL